MFSFNSTSSCLFEVWICIFFFFWWKVFFSKLRCFVKFAEGKRLFLSRSNSSFWETKKYSLLLEALLKSIFGKIHLDLLFKKFGQTLIAAQFFFFQTQIASHQNIIFEKENTFSKLADVRNYSLFCCIMILLYHVLSIFSK